MSAPSAKDYRPREDRRSEGVFAGNPTTLYYAILGAVGVFVVAYGFSGQVPPAGGYLLAGLIALFALLYWYFNRIVFRQPRFVSATATPPPEVAPPSQGHIRATIQKREATYRTQHAPIWLGLLDSYQKRFELLCWVTLSETAARLLAANNLTESSVISIPSDLAAGVDGFLDDKIDRGSIEISVGQLLSRQPLLLSAANALVRDELDGRVREGLKSLTAAIAHLEGGPRESNETFEL